MLSTKQKIGLARTAYRFIVSARKLFGLDNETEVIRDGIHWHLDLSEGIDLAIYLLGKFENTTVRTYRRFLRQGDSVLDIGANIGAHTLHLAACVGDTGHVVAFEPTAYAYRKLLCNLSLNPHLAARVYTEQIMLTDRDETIAPSNLYASWPLITNLPSVHPKHLGLAKSTTGARALTLDHYLDSHPEVKPDFIKLDVDGNECSMLRGARQTLQRYHPMLLMEIMPYGLEETGHSLDELLSILADSGYELFSIPDLASLPPQPELLNKRIVPGGSINVLCRPAPHGV